MAGLFPFGLFVYPCTMKKTKPGRKASGVLVMALLLLLSGGPLGGWAAEGKEASGKASAAATAGADLGSAGQHRQWLAGMEERPGTHPQPGQTGIGSTYIP